MNMTFGDNNSALKLNLPFRADEKTARGSFQITGLTYNAGDSETSCVGYRNLHLCLLSAGAQYDNFFKPPLWSDHRKPLLARILSGLAQFF